MLKVRIIVVDRTRTSFLREGESFYLERLKRYARVEWAEVKPARISKGRPDREILAEEGQAIVRRLAPRDYMVALDRSGDPYDSEELARWLDRTGAGTGGFVSFVIGGPLGLSREVLGRAGEVLSLSRLTLTHEMIRLVFLEQLYRAFTILRGEKYHK